MKNSLRIHKWTHNEFNIFILGVLTHPLIFFSMWLTIFCKPVLNKLLLLWIKPQLVFRLYRHLALVEL